MNVMICQMGMIPSATTTVFDVRTGLRSVCPSQEKHVKSRQLMRNDGVSESLVCRGEFRARASAECQSRRGDEFMTQYYCDIKGVV
jgi:hypothetical protein